jgi:hypothetical protein
MAKHNEEELFNVLIPDPYERLMLSATKLAMEAERAIEAGKKAVAMMEQFQIEKDVLQFAFDIEFEELEERFWASYR